MAPTVMSTAKLVTARSGDPTAMASLVALAFSRLMALRESVIYYSIVVSKTCKVLLVEIKTGGGSRPINWEGLTN